MQNSRDSWGYIDHSGRMVIPSQFKQASRFSESLAAVQIENDKWGYIDRSGHFAIQPEFDSRLHWNHGALCLATRVECGRHE